MAGRRCDAILPHLSPQRGPSHTKNVSGTRQRPAGVLQSCLNDCAFVLDLGRGAITRGERSLIKSSADVNVQC